MTFGFNTKSLFLYKEEYLNQILYNITKGDIMQNDKIFRIDDPYAFLTRELLEKEYIENKLTDQKIAEKYNIGSKATVWKRRKFYRIANSCQNKSNQNALKNRKFVVSKENALMWQQEGKTYDEMASIVGCSRMVLYRRIKELGVVTECPEEMKKLKWHEKISDHQFKFLLGDLLGDGSITPWGMYQCSHSHKQKLYIEYKKEVLSNLVSPSFNFKERTIDNYQNGKKYRTYYLRTMGNEFLKEMNKKFYVDRVKIFPYEYLMQSDFDAYSLAIWYMDDGSRNDNSATLHTYGFGFDGNLQIVRFLFNKFNISSEIKNWGKIERSPDKSSCIYFSPKSSSDKFFQIVSPHILPNFQYKLPIKYRFIPQK